MTALVCNINLVLPIFTLPDSWYRFLSYVTVLNTVISDVAWSLATLNQVDSYSIACLPTSAHMTKNISILLLILSGHPLIMMMYLEVLGEPPPYSGKLELHTLHSKIVLAVSPRPSPDCSVEEDESDSEELLWSMWKWVRDSTTHEFGTKNVHWCVISKRMRKRCALFSLTACSYFD